MSILILLLALIWGGIIWAAAQAHYLAQVRQAVHRKQPLSRQQQHLVRRQILLGLLENTPGSALHIPHSKEAR